MRIYFWLIRLAAFFGHRKARLLVDGQRNLRLEELSLGGSSPVIWFHAASVGEFEQARPVIERLKAKDKRYKVIVTFFSPSGYELRKNYPLADKVMYLPFATRSNAKRFLEAVKPTMAVFVKYEFWPAYLRELKKRNIPTYLISGIFNPKQLFFRPWGVGYRRLLGAFTRLFVQDIASQELLAKYNITNVTVVGDTRFDRVTEISAQAKQIPILEQFATDRTIIAGSTWEPDEKFLAHYMEDHEDVKLVLAPHEINDAHMHTIFQLFKGRFVRYTEATTLNIAHVRVLVIDTIGLLSSIYRYGQVAYVGGGFGVGIHNTLEPAVYGMPVLFGPNYERFREANGLIAAGAAGSFNTYKDFELKMDTALEYSAEYGVKAKEYIASELGATDKILNSLTV